MSKKNILIVDPFSTGAMYADEFIAQGCSVYALISNENVSDYLKQGVDKEKYCHVFFAYEACLRFFSDNKLFIAIAGSESGVYLADNLNEALRIQANPAVDSVIRRDKYLMQQALRAYGLRYIRSSKVVSSDQDIKFHEAEASKWVVKPLNSAGSDGVMIFENRSVLQDYIKQYDWQKMTAIGEECKGLILQEFIAGDEYVVDLVKGVNSFLIASVCKYTKVGETGLVYHCLDVLDPADSAYVDLIQYAVNCANALSLVKGPMHMEFIKDNTGFVMIEAGARLHGGIAPEFFKSCYTPHLLQAAVDSFLNKPFQCNKAYKKRAGRIVFLHTNSDCIMPSIDALKLQELQRLESYQGHKFFISEGSNISKTVSLFDCPGIVWLAHEDVHIIDDDEKQVRKLLSFYKKELMSTL
ncbi:ATP-grasp domain-containing protein [Facilibium subflavum]|uniref:ATP-grasp domain-containing protein n=1 Tax=Facilibium subflavum TaxID=2219058 RepID=UPI000E64AAD3|nr:ATP-grasp domain-containing protein [Facilibium subflavum]